MHNAFASPLIKTRWTSVVTQFFMVTWQCTPLCFSQFLYFIVTSIYIYTNLCHIVGLCTNLSITPCTKDKPRGNENLWIDMHINGKQLLLCSAEQDILSFVSGAHAHLGPIARHRHALLHLHKQQTKSQSKTPKEGSVTVYCSYSSYVVRLQYWPRICMELVASLPP